MTTNAAFVCDYVRTAIGRYGGSLSHVRPNDLAAFTIRCLMEKNASVDWAAVDEVILGCANQSGEDNRNVARMATLLSGLPHTVPATTINRLCASGMDAVGTAARAISAGELHLIIAGGVESMSRAPFVMGKSEEPFDRHSELFDTTLGWRFVNPKLKEVYGCDSMVETGDHVAAEYGISREDQDAFGFRSQQRAAAAQQSGYFAAEIAPISVPYKKQISIVDTDEHPRASTLLDALARLRPVNSGGTVTAGNAAGINDGAASLIVASESAASRHGLPPLARVLGMATAGVQPRIMGMGPAPAIQKLLARLKMNVDEFGVIEINEAFASQALACLRALGIPDDANHVNPNGGAIALGHPLGMSGARLVLTAVHQMQSTGVRFGLAAMCVGVGQGVAIALERV
jgi:3-oxoadipyl-CoA thiolase